MAHPLELSYNWRAPVSISSLGLLISIGLLAHSSAPGRWSAAFVVTGCWAAFMVVVWLRTRAYLMVDGPVLTVRRFGEFHRFEGSQLVKVTESLTPSGASYKLTVRREDGALVRHAAPTALLRKGHSTLFTWILTSAPHAELDKGSRRTLDDLRVRGLVEGPTT